MITFRRRTFWESTLYRCWPPYRYRRDAKLEGAIRKLVADPSLPCEIDGVLIPDGYGRATTWERIVSGRMSIIAPREGD